ncbi:SLAP domain-containing protein [Ureibacillus sinduriensis]|uniref:SLAP domain-containing protein n=1 Tax=Ureibacillus sinduriensis BLB-1 = JCM 15800 TaxID=1384057 RepID=A0A0A3HUG6_9BACL|nr:SLAP domain-containing protein [Ureibacillus sinduriensis]KGR76231.1 hypothetical protein CD33_06690 [Ureibacillus sinduriensis BLB-1 = JCM 15800]
MQQLQFEASWDKALAAEDRLEIKRIFDETKRHDQSDIVFTPIREANNHEEALLVTVLVHNFTNESLSFQNTRLLYSIQGEVIAEETFTLPALSIPHKTSMPWTFIFPKGSYQQQSDIVNGHIRLI